MKGLIRKGVWVEIRYESKAGNDIWMEKFHPTLKTGTKAIDEFTATFLSENDNVKVINEVKLI